MIDLTGLPTPPNAPPVGTCVRIERPEAGLVRLVLDPPHRSMPVFDQPLLRDLDLALAEVERDPAVKGLVITGRDAKTFAAGADIDAIAALTDRAIVERVVGVGQELFARLDALGSARPGFTSVAAIGGPAAGGACELALACSFVLLADTKETRLGLPETMLGILPGWGGTTRLPRRIGLTRALDAILTGKLYAPREALRAGLADRICAAEDLLRIASDVALHRSPLAPRSRGWKRLILDANPVVSYFIVDQARKRVLDRTHGHYPAPLHAILIAGRAGRSSTRASFQAEREAVAELATGSVAKNLIRIFTLSESAKKLDRLEDGRRAGAPERVGVLGAGVMGRAIASSAAERGAWTRLFDIVPAALDTALLEHRADVDTRLRRRRMQKSEAERAIDRLDVTAALVGFAHSDLVIEAVAERLEVKRKVFAELARTLRPDAILATNTSSLSVDAIAEGIPHPERVVGLHFFNPVKKMPLVEIVRGSRTSPAAIARCAAFALRLGKTPVVTSDCAGFLVNRLLGPYLDESLRLLEGGVDAQRIDRSLRAFGMPMGPLELLDEVGFDIAQHAARSLHEAYGARMSPSRVLDAPVAAKRLGKKSGLGFYEHLPGLKSKPKLAPDVARLVPVGAPRARQTAEEAIAERVLLAMLAEAARALAEGVVASARELDLATVFGMGFAPFRGGLLAWADTLGAREIVTRLEALQREPDIAARQGGRERFEPNALLCALARDGRRFHDA